MKRKLSVRHYVIINMPLTLLLSLIKERVLSKFLSNTVDHYKREGYEHWEKLKR